MLRTVYIETKVISYLAARPSRDLITAAHQTVTHEWWNGRGRFRLYSSDAVALEAERGDPEASKRRATYLLETQVLPITDEAGRLARELMVVAKLPEVAQFDALHVAIAALNRIDVLLTWNCRHLAGAVYRTGIECGCARAGYRVPIICTPLELPEK